MPNITLSSGIGPSSSDADQPPANATNSLESLERGASGSWLASIKRLKRVEKASIWSICSNTALSLTAGLVESTKKRSSAWVEKLVSLVTSHPY